MIQIQLKAKHFYLISEILFGYAAYTSFSTLHKIKVACSGASDDDLVIIESDVNTITSVFQTLSQKPEGSYNMINDEMLQLLSPQIATGISNNEQEWIDLGDNVTAIRAANLDVITTSIANGKSRLYN
jgi:hypothetical protein